ncbi:MAG: FtsX-like permease family protein [Spirochaetes bacterium]|jgi:putative ABC transport system permease protein|nr:FtsX-like permease family protein [Spirochaetota bacterium]
MNVLKLAVLSLTMHTRRTVVIIFAIAIAVAVMLAIDAMLSGMRTSFFEDSLQDSGHIQLHDAAWADRLEPLSLRHTIEKPGELVGRLKEDPRVTAAESLLRFGALTIAEDERMPQVGIGIAPDTSYFSNAREGMQRGHLPQNATEISISTKVSDILERDTGDPLVVLVQDSQGTPYYVEYTISGVFQTNSEQFDTTSFFITHDAAQELVYLENESIEIRVSLKNPDMAAAFRQDHGSLFQEYNVSAQTWREIHGSFIVVFELFDVFVFFINFLVAIVSATVITNAVLMNFFRRIDEFGTLRAIGLKRRRQSGLILAEGAVQGVAGAIIGIAVGAPLALYFQANGIDLGAITEAFNLGNTIYFDLRFTGILRSLGFGVLIAVASSGYAAWVGGKMRIIDMFAGKR